MLESSLLSLDGVLHGALEDLVREEVEGPHKDDPGVVAGLEAGDQERVGANSVGELQTPQHLDQIWLKLDLLQ